VIQTKVLTDSVVPPFTAIVDSIVIDNVSGLPAGFTYSCTPSSCSFPGGADACILLEGPAPTVQMGGIYPLIVHTTIYFKIAGTPQNLTDDNDDYSIVIDTTTGISFIDRAPFSIGQSIPNPAKDNVIIPVTLTRPDEINLKIVNLIGKKVFSRTYSLSKGKSNLSIDLHGFQPGIYLYTISNNVNSIAKRMIISND
jgi:Secretion system C-terminal sorting domain